MTNDVVFSYPTNCCHLIESLINLLMERNRKTYFTEEFKS